MNLNKRSAVAKICEVCKNPYFPTVQTFARAKYCSTRCKKCAINLEVIKHCKVCGDEFHPKKWERKRICCSVKCMRRLPRKHRHKHSQSEQAKERRRTSGKFAGQNNGRWNGGRYVSNGYVYIIVGVKKYKPEHVMVAEKLLGRSLKRGEIPHHVNMDSQDNRPENIVVCPNRTVHSIIHQEYGRVLVKTLNHAGLVDISRRVITENAHRRKT